jgi:predicted aldo/keto reductase-like oxidoreductase
VGVFKESDLERVEKARITYEGFQLIPCTNCGYCMPCPEGVDIPRILKIYNDGIMYDKIENAKNDYNLYVPDDNKGDLCVECGECIEKCPQDIAVPEWLAKIHQEFTE